MGKSYPSRTNARGIWKLSDITKNKITDGTYPGSSGHTALCGGGHDGDPTNIIDVFNMLTSGNAVDFGDLTAARSGCSTNSNHTRMVLSGGETDSNFAAQDYVHFATKGNAADFGDLSEAQGNITKGTGNNIKAVTSSGSGNSDLLNTFTFATLGSSTTFGNLTAGRNGAPQGVGDGVRGTYAGGMAPNQSDIIDFIQITTNSNATDFGDLSVARGEASSADSKTRAICFSGRTNTPSGGTIADIIDSWQIASQGNAVDFGDMHVARKAMAGGLSNTIKGFSAGGNDGSNNINSIEQNTIASAGNGSDFGDLSVARSACPGNTSGHGGLAAGESSEFHPRSPELYSPTGKILSRSGSLGNIGIFGGGQNPNLTNIIDFATISSLGNNADFGDMVAASRSSGGASNNIRTVFSGVRTPSNTNNLEYVEFATKGNAANFGDVANTYAGRAGFANTTRGITAGGYDASDNLLNVIEYITMASIGNSSDFGDLTAARQSFSGHCSSTRGVFGGGYESGSSPYFNNTIDYITIASTGNATDFGDLLGIVAQPGSNVSSNVRGVFAGGVVPSVHNVIQYITIASTGNATDFGDLTDERRAPGGASTNIRGLIAGGYANPATVATIDYITIASTGNAADYGDMTVAREDMGSGSNGHGGLN